MSRSMVRPSPESSATIWPRENTSARWQSRATSSKSVETTTTLSPDRQRLIEQAVDLRLGADVDAGGRILGDQQPAADAEPAPDDDLLLVAARKRLDRQRRDRWDAGRRVRRWRGPARPRRAATAGRRNRGRWRSGLRKTFSRIVRPLGRGFLDAVARDEADPGAHRRSRARQATARFAVEQDFAGVRQRAEQRPPDALLARAAQADEADDLAGRDGEIDRPGAVDRQPARASRVGGRSRARRRLELCRAPCRRSARPAPPAWSPHPPFADQRAVAQHGDAVGDLEHLVEPVRDVDHADAARLQRPQRVENRRCTSSAGSEAEGSSSTSTSAWTLSARAIATSDFSVRLRSRTRMVGGAGNRPARAPAASPPRPRPSR